MNKDFYIECLEELINEYLDLHPKASEDEAYRYASEHVDAYAISLMTDMADYAKDMDMR